MTFLGYFADSIAEHTASNTKMLRILLTKSVKNYHSVNFRAFSSGFHTLTTPSQPWEVALGDLGTGEEIFMKKADFHGIIGIFSGMEALFIATRQ